MKDPVYRFAEFELDPATGELRNGKGITRLQDKPLRLLLVLLDNPERIVSRDQLRERMWDSRVVIEFEQGINAAIRKVRDALGDSAGSPRFIETVARRGYRFKVPVLRGEAPQPVPAVESAPALAGTRRPPRVRWRRVLAATLPVLLVTLGFGWYATQQARPLPPVHSIAVLPLRNLSPDPDQEFFADGVTEDVIARLAQTLPLRVISRASVMRYRNATQPMGEIARELGVEAIVEGAVARSGDRVSITVRLIDPTEERRLWADEYERGLEDILGVEDAISSAIGAQLGGTQALRSGEPGSATRVDPRAYEWYLRGRYHWNQRTPSDFARAEHYFKRAVERDRGFAPAWAGLADVYALWPFYAAVDIDASLAEAEASARAALELDDSLAGPHATLGLLAVSTRHWSSSAPYFRRALELNPNYAAAHHWFSWYYLFAGRHSEALAELQQARRLDPLSAVINADFGHLLYVMHRFEAARPMLRRAMELQPGFGQPHATLALVELESGNRGEAETQARAALALDPLNPRTMGEAGYIFAMIGKPVEAEALLAELHAMVGRGAALRTFPALVEIGLGRRDQAVDELERIARTSSGVGLPGVDQWHAFDELIADARVRELVSQAR